MKQTYTMTAMYRYMLCLIILAWLPIVIFAQESNRLLVKSTEDLAVDYANVEFLDSADVCITVSVTNADGFVTINAQPHIQKLRISKLGYEPQVVLRPFPEEVTLLEASSYLEEVTVVGRASLVKQTASGMVYRMSNNAYAQQQNLLEALRFVPLLDISNAGEIAMVGKQQYRIYIDGRPFDLAEANPSKALQSIAAKDVKQIEVITSPDKRFHNATESVINIITHKKVLEGFSINSSVNATTQPAAKAAVAAIGTKGNVDFSASYDYDLKTQRNQPIRQNYQQKGCVTDIDGEGDGDWHTHRLRSMLLWKIDTLSTLYADVHAKILQTGFTTAWTENEKCNLDNAMTFYNNNDNTQGAIETNVKYRNYYRTHPTSERVSIGYRYTYNPDRRHYLQRWGDNGNFKKIKTDGSMHEHIASVDLSSLDWRMGTLTVGCKAIWRIGDTKSTDLSDLHYNETLVYPHISLAGSKGNVAYSFLLSGEYDRLAMESRYSSANHPEHETFYLTPAAMLATTVKGFRLSANYACSTQRPAIEMLNPFFSIQNPLSASVGNPNLRNETKHRLSVEVSKYIPGLYYSFGVTAMRTIKTIVRHQIFDAEDTVFLYRYDNMGAKTTLTGNLFVQWQPNPRLVVKCSANGGWYQLRHNNGCQKDYTLNIFGWVDYYLAKGWRIGINVMHFKQEPEPYSTINAITQYAATIGKSWRQGRLTANVEISTPFQKYTKMRVYTSADGFEIRKINYMHTRYIGVNLSYTMNTGKKTAIKRDTSLKHNDQTNGVE